MSTPDKATLLAELDALFGKAPTKPKAKSKGKALPRSPSSPVITTPRPERYWLPEAVVLYTSSWQCTCGGRGTCAPQLTVRERCGAATRLRSIPRPGQYSHLPRRVEWAEAHLIHACPECFGTGDGDGQIPLPFGDPATAQLARFIEEGLRAADFAEALCEPGNARHLSPTAREVRLQLITSLRAGFEKE